MIKRYDLINVPCHGGCDSYDELQEVEDGGWVRYEDHAAEVERLSTEGLHHVALILAARNELPDLLAELRTLRARVAELERATPSLEWIDLRPAHEPMREMLALSYEQGRAMTWIRCSDRMPMGEACEVRCHDCVWGESEHIFPSATVETLRRAFADGRGGDWIDRTEWRPVGETDLKPHVYTVKPGCDEAVRDLLRSDKPVPEKLRELMADRYDTDPDTIRAALRRFGFTEQARMLQEECGELIAAINRWFRDRDDAFDSMIEEAADVSILLDQMRLVYGAELDEARARKLARLRERLGR